MLPTIPAATYRLQFNEAFTFDAATAIVDYLDALGMSHAYASSYLAGGPVSYRHVLTGTTVCARESGERRVFRAAEVFADFPIAFQESR